MTDTKDTQTSEDQPLSEDELKKAGLNADGTDIEQQPEADAKPEGEETKPDPKVRQLTNREIGMIRRTERLTGKNAALEGLKALATQLGYDSIEEMQSAIPKKGGAQTQTPPEAKPEKTNKAQDDSGLERLKELERQNTLLQKKLEREKSNTQAAKKSVELASIARKTGIVDEDYALHLLRRHISTLEPGKAAKVDPAAFFAGLRKTNAHLFGEAPAAVTRQVASTSPTTKPAPTAPSPAQGRQKQSEDGAVDTTTMSRAEFDAYMAKKGIRNPRFIS